MSEDATESPEPGFCPVTRLIEARQLLEGGGFPVHRPFPLPGLQQLDPFLLLDHMGPVDWPPGEAIGAPEHPHRGFETVTYLLEGRMQHSDSAGHRGELGPGDVQWMTAGAGIIHAELPHPEFQQRGGVMNGFQLWINLPAEKKMMMPRYQEIPAALIPIAESTDGKVEIRVIAGEALGQAAIIATVIPITFLHLKLQPGARFEQPVTMGHTLLAYVFSGQVAVGVDGQLAGAEVAVLFGVGDRITLTVAATAMQSAELLLLAGPPLGQPMVRHGPFVMNTREQIDRALQDYRDGVLGVY